MRSIVKKRKPPTKKGIHKLLYWISKEITNPKIGYLSNLMSFYDELSDAFNESHDDMPSLCMKNMALKSKFLSNEHEWFKMKCALWDKWRNFGKEKWKVTRTIKYVADMKNHLQPLLKDLGLGYDKT